MGPEEPGAMRMHLPYLLQRADERKARAEAMTAVMLAVDLFMRRIGDGFDVREAYIFGSHARREDHEDSDVDVAVVLGGRSDLSETVFHFSGVAYDVFMETDVLVDAHPLWEDEWLDPSLSPNPHLTANIRRDGIRLAIESRE